MLADSSSSLVGERESSLPGVGDRRGAAATGGGGRRDRADDAGAGPRPFLQRPKRAVLPAAGWAVGLAVSVACSDENEAASSRMHRSTDDARVSADAAPLDVGAPLDLGPGDLGSLEVGPSEDLGPIAALCPPTEPFGTRPGETFPDIRLPDCDGQMHALHAACSRRAAYFFVYAHW